MIVILYVLAPYTGIGNLYPYEVLPIRGLHIYILQSADKRQRHLPKELIFQSSSMIRIALGMKNKVMRRQTFVGGISRLYLYIRVRMKAREGGYGGYGEKRREEKRKKKLDFGNASSCCQVPNPKRGGRPGLTHSLERRRPLPACGATFPSFTDYHLAYRPQLQMATGLAPTVNPATMLQVFWGH
jgi:hypothetical protein